MKQDILEFIHADYLAVIADESTDISGQTQLVIVSRFIFKSSGEYKKNSWKEKKEKYKHEWMMLTEESLYYIHCQLMQIVVIKACE